MNLPIPPQLKDSFFFPENAVKVDPSHLNAHAPFFNYELIYYNKKTVHTIPWKEPESFIEDILVRWGKEKELLASLFKERSMDTLDAMKRSIALFYMLLYWSNSQPVNLNQEDSRLDDLSIKPVNVIERMMFIRDNPTLFHAYIQLSQLFEEQHKQYAKALALEKTKRKLKRQ
ncbi:hypothetical protein QTG56_14090 [Rossellomorea sp. AcN35-11]|nr:hypothetical protein [Rossellomorea aquimaris]WJV28244.1 hypothetical protein QTG56_14090 [Rossellomorea sp. AcN35-11]